MQIHTDTKKYFFPRDKQLQKIVFAIALGLSATPWVGAGLALLLGLIITQSIGNPLAKYNSKITHYLLQFSVVSLGFGMNANSALKAGKEGILFTVFSILSTLIFGYFLGKIFRTERKTSYLINCGTAVCGGSAIAAVAPVIQAEEKQMSVALGCVFMLNAIALYLFPVIGHYLQLSQVQFGTWCAIAIHDTSSVVGASGKFGAQAQEVATTIKLARALWIIPISLISGFLFKNKKSKIKLPYFIALFVLAMLINTYFPVLYRVDTAIVHIGKMGLNVTLFFIGTSLSPQVVKTVGIKPLLHGVLLWLFIGSLSLCAVLYYI